MQNRILGFTGRKGSGKSTLLAGLLRKEPRIVIWDPLYEYAEFPNPFANGFDLLRICVLRHFDDHRCKPPRKIKRPTPFGSGPRISDS